MLNRKNLWSWLPLAFLALVVLTGLRPVVLGAVQRGLLATGRWRAALPAPAPTTPPVLTGGAPCPHQLPLTTLEGQPVNLSELKLREPVGQLVPALRGRDARHSRAV